MPTFRTAPSSSLTASIRRMLQSGGAQLGPLGEVQADMAAAQTARNMSLAEKARAEVEAMQAAEAQRNDPAIRTEYAAHTAGIDMPDATRLMRAIRGEVDPNPQGPADASDNVYGDVQAIRPEKIGPGQERLFRHALAAVQANLLGSGKTNAEQLTAATGNVQTQNLVQMVQDAIAKGDFQGASAISQGAKPGTAIKLHENIGTTGATFTPAMGEVAADPAADPANALLAGTVAESSAKAAKDRAAAEESRAKAAAERTGGGTGKPPPGFRWKDDGSLEAIPGGPADIKVGAEGAKANNRLAIARGKADIVIGAVDKALKQTGFFTTGLIGENLGKLAGTPAFDLRKTVTTIKANIGFQELQAMREASPTGGALGQVAIQELEALQAVLASLDAGQSTEQLTENLTKVKQHYENWKRTVAQSDGEERTRNLKDIVGTGGEVQARKKIGAVEYVKINGQWHAP